MFRGVNKLQATLLTETAHVAMPAARSRKLPCEFLTPSRLDWFHENYRGAQRSLPWCENRHGLVSGYPEKPCTIKPVAWVSSSRRVTTFPLAAKPLESFQQTSSGLMPASTKIFFACTR